MKVKLHTWCDSMGFPLSQLPRDVGKFGNPSHLGCEDRRFKSCHPDTVVVLLVKRKDKGVLSVTLLSPLKKWISPRSVTEGSLDEKDNIHAN